MAARCTVCARPTTLDRAGLIAALERDDRIARALLILDGDYTNAATLAEVHRILRGGT